jgi:CheY-like chemotaxis protein
LAGDLAARRLLLLVDDDDEWREVASAVLTGAGFHVVAARHGADAIDRVRRRGSRPHAIVLDLQMPVMDGWTFLNTQATEPLLAHVPVLVHSGEPDVDESLSATVRGVLRKPANLNELIQAVRRACDGVPQARPAMLAAGTGSIPTTVDVTACDAPPGPAVDGHRPRRASSPPCETTD